MHYTVFLLALLFWSLPTQARACRISLETRQQLQIFQHVLASWQQEPLWPGLQAAHLVLHPPGDSCHWLFTAQPPPEAERLPDFPGVYALPQAAAAPPPADEPLFCQPFAAQLEAGGPAQPLAYKEPGLTELRALQVALAATTESQRREGGALFLAARTLAGGPDWDLPGVRAWLCFALETRLASQPQPPELRDLQLFRSPEQRLPALLTENPNFWSPEQRSARGGLLQILLLERLGVNWQAPLGQGHSLARQLAQAIPWQPAQAEAWRARVQALETVWQPPLAASLDNRGFQLEIELPLSAVDVYPRHFSSLSAEQLLLLGDSELRIQHPGLRGLIRGTCLVTQRPGQRLLLRIKLNRRADLVRDSDPTCPGFQIETPQVSLRGQCLRGKPAPAGYRLELN
jgi:hypothetical protein